MLMVNDSYADVLLKKLITAVLSVSNEFNRKFNEAEVKPTQDQLGELCQKMVNLGELMDLATTASAIQKKMVFPEPYRLVRLKGSKSITFHWDDRHQFNVLFHSNSFGETIATYAITIDGNIKVACDVKVLA